MIFKSLKLIEGMATKKFEFSSSVNLVHSENNSKGKTTLLRFLLYSIGYAIPNTKNIKFENCITECEIECESGLIKAVRQNDYLETFQASEKRTYILPHEVDEFHFLLFGTNNKDILNNLLGTFYIDQEKGWTLLNRGTVIGKNHFTIEHLILGLSDRDCSELIKELKTVERELSKYRQMFNIAQYQAEINELKENLVFEALDEAVQRQLEILKFDSKSILEELKRINKVIDENTSFKNYIEKMKIRVMGSNGEEIPVNKQTIVDFQDNVEILIAKRRIITAELSSIKREINKLDKVSSQQETLLKTETLIQSFDKKISAFEIDAVTVEKIVTKLGNERVKIKKAISAATKHNNQVVVDIYNTIKKYAAELDLEKSMNPRQDFIFTDDLKSLSGAILHKIVFVFNLAYIKAVQDKLKISLPIILDSPSGRELDKTNIDKMMDILNRDFKENQIIISSIFTYSFDNMKVFELGDLLIDKF
jgi:hypothetical protein